jgi:transposase-like protein
MEIITGVERRRRWRTEDKLRIVAEAEQPGACFADVARRYEISRGLLWNWRSKVRHGTLTGRSVPSFLPVRVAAEPVVPDPRPSDGRIEITLPDGSHVQVDNNVSLTALRRVMSVLRG